MKKLLLCALEMEKSALLFIKHGLESVLYVIFLLLLKSKLSEPLCGVEKAVFCREMSECITYLLLSVTLIIGGGLFLDYAIKREGFGK